MVNSTKLTPDKCSKCGNVLLFSKWNDSGERWVECRCGNKSEPIDANPGKVVREWNKQNVPST